MELKEDEIICIICLVNSQNNEIPFKYDGLCQCTPYIHMVCLNKWFEKRDNICPICHGPYRIYEEAYDDAYVDPNIFNRRLPFENNKCNRVLMIISFFYLTWIILTGVQITYNI
jgi:E3 ubiquitin-protein ligase DOA10